MKEWKTAGALLLAGAIVFMQGIAPARASTDTQITAKAETLTYYESKKISEYFYGASIEIACDYTITENQSWDDTLGEPVYDNYITIEAIKITSYLEAYTYAPADYYTSYGSIRSGSMELDGSGGDYTLDYTIPAEIDGIPVRIINAYITYNSYGNYSSQSHLTTH
ncbi:MAG: hypothetical protein K2I93_02215, partial [Oscillospiraceae bacterium]|nr:hypothetical protein [Oscillospiraceae bacterium]